jgi:hypothetical protein
MMALRNRFMNDRPVLNLVSVDSYDLVEIFGQHTRGHQTRYARANHNGSPSECLCHGLMPKAYPDFGVHSVAYQGEIQMPPRVEPWLMSLNGPLQTWLNSHDRHEDAVLRVTWRYSRSTTAARTSRG